MPSEHASPWYHDSFCFSARVCGEKILNMQWVFSFPRVAGDTAIRCTWGFYCGPFCKTVRFSLLYKTAAIQKERKDRDGPFMGFVFDELPSGFVCLGREQVNHHELPKIVMSKFLRLADETQDEELFSSLA